MLAEITFRYPLILWALPALLLLRAFRQRTALAEVPAPNAFLAISSSHVVFPFTRTVVLEALHLLFLAFVVMSAARPITTERIVPTAAQRRNLILALDVSRSMVADDFRSANGIITRMEGVKQVTERFVLARAGDRLGLVVFGSAAYLQAPLTIDHELLIDIIQKLRVGIAGDGTAVGDGLGLALKRIQELPSNTRAIILITDGVSNSDQVEPLKAAQIAKRLGVRVYTIGIGSPEGSFINLGRGILRQRIRADFDEATLKAIAQETGGKYYFASDLNALDTIYREINSLERSTEDDHSFDRLTEWFGFCAWIAMILFVLHFVLSQTLLRVFP